MLSSFITSMLRFATSVRTNDSGSGSGNVISSAAADVVARECITNECEWWYKTLKDLSSSKIVQCVRGRDKGKGNVIDLTEENTANQVKPYPIILIIL